MDVYSIAPSSHGQNTPYNDNSSENSSISSTPSGTWSPPTLTAALESSDLVVSIELSDSELTIKLGSNPFLEMPPLLLRKKSGELVKLSLKLPSLARCKSALVIPMKKSVSFALRLENIRMFDGKDSPSTVSTTDNSPLHSPRGGRSLYFSWDWDHSMYNDPQDDDDSCQYLTSDEEDVVVRKSWKIESSDVPFIEPSRLHNEHRPVMLQLVALAADKKTLLGFILCKNLDFEKNLSIKLTTNAWKSSIIISNATYVQSFKTSNYDQFKFLMPLLNYRSFIALELVIRYTAKNQTYWDNNNTRNYHINLKTIQPVISHKNSVPEFEDLVNRLVSVKQEIGDGDRSFVPRLKSSFGRYNFEDVPLKPIASVTNFNPSARLGDLRSAVVSRPPLKASFSNSDVTNVKPRYSNTFKNKNLSSKQGLPATRSSPLKSVIIPESPKQSSGAFSTTPFSLTTAPAASASLSSHAGTTNNSVFIDLSGSSKNVSSKNPRESFNSKSYTDLINAYCFYKGDTPQTESAPNLATESSNKSSPALFTGLPPAIPASVASTFHSFSDSIHI